MSNVYLKNKTSSAITVSGYSVYYIDKTDAEIVEVKGVDNITVSDDASGTISAVTLPTSHSYTGVSFDSLRYYAKGTLSNTGSATNLWGRTSTWFYGTITWTDESLGDLSDKIIVNSTSSSAIKTQTVFRIIFISPDRVIGYHPMDTAESSYGQVTDYSFNNGVHSITFYLESTNWTYGVYAGRIQFRYLDGVTTFNNLSAFDLISVSGGLLLKDTTTDRYDMYNAWNDSITIHARYHDQIPVKYNAFKYSLSGVPYWYVIDGIQANWTDDLASIGYSEVLPLPTVSVNGDFGTNNWLFRNSDGSVGSISAGGTQVLWIVNDQSQVPYDSTKSYAVLTWYYGTGDSDVGANGSLSIVSSSDYIAAKNDTSSTINLYALRCAVCSSADATVVHVYDKATGVAYNAFKYASEGTDYYYILDGVQSDWSDDIDSLGFALGDGFTEITLYMASGQKDPQTGVTSAFTGNVSSSSCYQLYTDEQCTTPWTGYDYSNDYKVGTIPSSGVWTEFIDSVAEMPDYVGSGTDFKVGRVLLDTGFLWFCCNLSSGSSVTTSTSKIVVRIYPKAQQHFAAYAYGASTYGNVSIAQSTSKQCVSKPGSTEYIQTPHQFPVITLQKILGAAGNELPLSQYFTYVGQDDSRFRIINKKTSSNVRTVVYTLEYPILGYWLKSDGTNISTSSGVAYPIMNIGGEIIEIDNNYDYFPIALIQHNGNYATATYSYLNKATMGAFDENNPTRLCFKQISGTLSLSYVQYYKAPKSIRTTFGSAVTIPAGFKPVAVKCLKLFIKASSITKESGSTAPINFEYAGSENEFCTDTDKALFGVGVNPCINMYGFSNASNFSLFMLSTDSSQTGSSYATSVSASKFNEDGYFVKGVATLKSNHNADTYAGYLQTNPMMFVKYNQGVGLPFYFTIQSSMWSYENGVFSWLGNDTDTTDLAYWYKSAPDVQIILEKLPTT